MKLRTANLEAPRMTQFVERLPKLSYTGKRAAQHFDFIFCPHCDEPWERKAPPDACPRCGHERH